MEVLLTLYRTRDQMISCYGFIDLVLVIECNLYNNSIVRKSIFFYLFYNSKNIFPSPNEFQFPFISHTPIERNLESSIINGDYK